jgi:hypothetical protein
LGVVLPAAFREKRGTERRYKKTTHAVTAQEFMAGNFLGTPIRRWIEYLIAILLGNAIYYFSLVPHLPPVLRHQGYLLDWGSLVDFIVCLGVYGLIRVGSKMRLSRSG